MSRQSAEKDAPLCPDGCADLITGEPYRAHPSDPERPDDGWFCPSCWTTVIPPGSGDTDD